MPMSEYESIKSKVRRLEREIEECVGNGKIKVTPIVKYVLSDLRFELAIPDIYWNGLVPFMTAEEVEALQNDKIKTAITDIHKKTTELSGQCNKLNKIEHELRGKTFIQRFKYLFTGYISDE